MPRSRRYFGKGYDPLWLYRHFVRMLEYTTDFRVRNDRVYDVLTGEIILEAPTLKELIDLILGRWSPPPQAE